MEKGAKPTLLMPNPRKDVTYTARLVKNLGGWDEATIFTDTFTITPMPHAMIPDLTHDGFISNMDLQWLYHSNTVFNIWRIWLNDDLPEINTESPLGPAKHRKKAVKPTGRTTR